MRAERIVLVGSVRARWTDTDTFTLIDLPGATAERRNVGWYICADGQPTVGPF